MKTLGLTYEELREMLGHLSYDGVYESTAERVRGGGSLSLRQAVASYLKIDVKILTGHWDLGHKNQLTLGDTFVNGEYAHIYSKNTDYMLLLMSSYKKDKAGLIFS